MQNHRENIDRQMERLALLDTEITKQQMDRITAHGADDCGRHTWRIEGAEYLTIKGRSRRGAAALIHNHRHSLRAWTPSPIDGEYQKSSDAKRAALAFALECERWDECADGFYPDGTPERSDLTWNERLNHHLDTETIEQIGRWIDAIEQRRIEKQHRDVMATVGSTYDPDGSTHHHDSHCNVDAETQACTVCGVHHGDPCSECGGRGFHMLSCSGCYTPDGEPHQVAPKKLRVLVACEFSGVVREAFRARGHDAWSCDVLPADDGSEYHIQDDVLNHLDDGWDMMIAHPPCTRHANSGVRWLHERNLWDEHAEAVQFFQALQSAPIERICIENPIMHKYSREALGAPTQYVQPYEHGHGETKRTGLHLKNLQPLVPTDEVAGREARVHKMAPGAGRWKARSVTYSGIARAMAAQWSEDVSAQEVK